MNYSWGDQLEIVKAIHLKDGERKTINCPFCGGPNKFTVDKIDGRLVWNCYRASCPAKGSYKGRRSLTAVKDFLASNKPQMAAKRVFDIPAIVTSPGNYPPAIEYLKSVNSLEAFEAGWIKVRYAPAEKRVLFYNQDHTGAVGRSLCNSKYKWWNYGQLSGGIHVGQGNHAVLVEDVPSACAVSRLKDYVGVALLGTNLTKGIKNTLTNYAAVTLVLDNDASKKAIVVVSSLAECKLRLTRADLKELTETQIGRILNVD